MTTTKKEEEEEEQEVEYVYEAPPEDDLFKDFAHVFQKFTQFDAVARANVSRKEEPDKKSEQQSTATGENKELALLEKQDENQQDKKQVQEANKAPAEQSVSKKKIKQLTRMTVAELKQKVSRPELVELHDVTAQDPVFLLHLKSTKNSVPVPRHWSSKRRYLQGKRGYEKPPFQLPDFIRQTGVMEMRDSVSEKDSGKSLKAKARERVQPKMGKIQMDYQQLHDAFFKWQTKPKLSIHGDLYYEGKEFEKRFERKPGELSNELRRALGMPTGSNAHRYPPPWLQAMKRHGPPPSYPYLRIPGLNCPFQDDEEVAAAAVAAATAAGGSTVAVADGGAHAS